MIDFFTNLSDLCREIESNSSSAKHTSNPKKSQPYFWRNQNINDVLSVAKIYNVVRVSLLTKPQVLEIGTACNGNFIDNCACDGLKVRSKPILSSSSGKKKCSETLQNVVKKGVFVRIADSIDWPGANFQFDELTIENVMNFELDLHEDLEFLEINGLNQNCIFIKPKISESM